MTLSLTRIPDDIAAGATVTFVSDVTKNTSQGGISGRKLMRPILRNYIVTVHFDFALEMQAIVMASYGMRYPLAFRDPVANSIDDEVALIADDGMTAQIQRTWAPATGNLSVAQDILIPDGPVIIKSNNVVVPDATVGDYGVVSFVTPLDPDTDIATVTCDYLTPVCMMDAASAIAFFTTQYQFNDMRLEEIFGPELRALTA